MDAVEFIKTSVDAEQLLRHYKVKRITKHGNNLRCCCPIHGGNNPTAFVLNLPKGLWFCHTGCKTGGDIFDLVMKMDNVDFETSVQHIAELFNIDITNMEISVRANQAIRDTQAWIDTMRMLLDEKHIEPFDLSVLGELYPINSYRHFTKTTLQEFGVQYCTNNQRIVVPIYYNHVLVGVTMRRTTPHPIKWLHQPAGLIAGQYLYNIDNIVPFEPLIVVEGVWDCINYYQHGYTNVVATFGCHMTEEQQRMVMQNAIDVIIAYDNDKAGIGGVENVIHTLGNKTNIKIAYIPEGRDAGELTQDEIIASITKSKTIYEWRKTI